jgi:hypothetical protein|tara:strand:+ start:561 stop:749 length:189 start_codon:yes stop_codon:yes gene_type:complete
MMGKKKTARMRGGGMMSPKKKMAKGGMAKGSREGSVIKTRTAFKRGGPVISQHKRMAMGKKV